MVKISAITFLELASLRFEKMFSQLRENCGIFKIKCKKMQKV